MRNREMDANDDYVFTGRGRFLINSPAAVAQAIKTRMRLLKNEWFLDKREGLNMDNLLGYGTAFLRDQEIKRRILQTPGARKLLRYYSAYDPQNGRAFHVQATVDTIYGVTNINEVF